MLISNTKRSCVMHSTGVPPRVSRGHEVWPRVAGTWATSDEDTSRSWQGLPLKTPHSHSSPHAALPQTRLLHTPPPRKFTASQPASMRWGPYSPTSHTHGPIIHRLIHRITPHRFSPAIDTPRTPAMLKNIWHKKTLQP